MKKERINVQTLRTDLRDSHIVDGQFIGNRLAYLMSKPERYDFVVFRQKDDDTLYSHQ